MGMDPLSNRQTHQATSIPQRTMRDGSGTTGQVSLEAFEKSVTPNLLMKSGQHEYVADDGNATARQMGKTLLGG